MRVASGIWYRAVPPQYAASALASRHTIRSPSRFNSGQGRARTHRALYFADDHVTALLEFRALLGSYPNFVSSQSGNVAVITVTVRTSRIIDLTDVNSQNSLGISAQMLTGDWKAYWTRTAHDPVPRPTGLAPTQELGEAIKTDGRAVTGIISISAVNPRRRILALFPENFDKRDEATYRLTGRNGVDRIISL